MSAPLEYVPTRFVAARLHEGWRLLAGMDYRAGEYAVLMHQGQHGRDLAPSVVEAALRRIGASKAISATSNKSRAAKCRRPERPTVKALRTAMGAR